MKKSQNSKCPECGLKQKHCQCQARNKKIFKLTLFIALLSGMAYLACWQWQIYIAKKSFFEALHTLPESKVKNDYYDLIQSCKIKIKFISNEKIACVYDKERNFLLISRQNIQTANIKEIWCILVHEHCHIYNDTKVTQSQMKTFSYWDWTKVIYSDEFRADLEENEFAQRNNFLEQTHPEVCEKMKIFGVDLKTATAMSTLDYLMKANFPPYEKLKPYFPKAFSESIEPKYRDKIKFN